MEQFKRSRPPHRFVCEVAILQGIHQQDKGRKQNKDSNSQGPNEPTTVLGEMDAEAA
jgi:hypothetical protein